MSVITIFLRDLDVDFSAQNASYAYGFTPKLSILNHAKIPHPKQ